MLCTSHNVEALDACYTLATTWERWMHVIHCSAMLFEPLNFIRISSTLTNYNNQGTIFLKLNSDKLNTY